MSNKNTNISPTDRKWSDADLVIFKVIKRKALRLAPPRCLGRSCLSPSINVPNGWTFLWAASHPDGVNGRMSVPIKGALMSQRRERTGWTWTALPLHRKLWALDERSESAERTLSCRMASADGLVYIPEQVKCLLWTLILWLVLSLYCDLPLAFANPAVSERLGPVILIQRVALWKVHSWP